MGRKGPSLSTKPRLRPSLPCTIQYHHFLYPALFVISFAILCSSNPFITIVRSLCASNSLSAESAAFALVHLLVYIVGATSFPIVYRYRLPLSRFIRPLLGYHIRYRRTHISHMRLDRFRRLVQALSGSRVRVSLSGGGPGVSTKSSMASRGRAWLNTLYDDSGDPHEVEELVEVCEELLFRLPETGIPKGPVPHHGLDTKKLAAFLSDEWLDDEMLMAGCEWALFHSGNKAAQLATVFLTQLLEKAQASSLHYSAQTPLDNAIQSGQVKTLYLPLNVKRGTHWALLQLDLVNHTYSYADCYSGELEPPKQQFDLITWWLGSIDPSYTTPQRAPFPVELPRQADGSSCGIIAMNLMAASLIGMPVWEQGRAHIERALWFSRLAPPVEDEMDEDYCFVSPASDNDGSSGSGSDDVPRLFDSKPRDLFSGGSNTNTVSGPSPPGTQQNPPCKRSLSTLSAASTVPDLASDSSDTALSDSEEGLRYKRRRGDGPKAGSSWAFQKALNLRSQDPDYELNQRKVTRFRTKVREIDPHAEFYDNDQHSVRCSACEGIVKMRALFDIRRFREHRQTNRCKARQSKGLMSRSLMSMGFGRPRAADRSVPCMVQVHCPGLTTHSDSKISDYLTRTSALTGGAQSRIRIARRIFDISRETLWTELSSKQQKAVLRREEVEAAWRNCRAVDAVFSAQCEAMVYTAVGKDPAACAKCKDLYDLKTFQAALRRPLPVDANLKYVPKKHRCPELGAIYIKYHGLRDLMEQDSPWLEFARGVVDGRFKSDVMLGMVKAMVVKTSRLEAGKGLRNLPYTGAFSDFCSVLASLAPIAYRTFQQQFGGPAFDTIRKWRAKKTRFQPGFSPVNFAVAAETLRSYDYHGPLALSWDDTELEPAISVYKESERTCLLVGSTDGVIRVDADSDLDALFDQAKMKQATKLRCWLLTVPLPKIPPILLAAEARGGTDSADDLKTMHDKVMAFLAVHDIHPTSAASDGTETERALQDLIGRSAPSSQSYTIPNTFFGPTAIVTLTIPLVDSQHPIVLVQDSKHALKTARNQLLTGARILTMGNDYLNYQQLHGAGVHPDGPLFKRDVERVDRQDDSAAARTFSPAMIDFNTRVFPQHRALNIYLFVLGELVDAWQNRRISHLDRAKMALRARFFLMAWRSHIVAHPDHSTETQFISRESFDIFITLCDSLLSLIIVYRNHFPTYPLLLWLHSTEPDEHLFGTLRKIKPDFTFADLLAVAHKLFILISGAFKNLTAEQKAQQTASGYHHTYFKVEDIDLRELARYPTDAELAIISDTAAHETSELCSYVGIDARKMIAKYSPPVRSARRQLLPAVPDGRQSLASLLSLYDTTWRDNRTEETIEACQFALAAESAAQSQTLQSLPEPTEEDVSGVRLLMARVNDELSADVVSPAPENSSSVTQKLRTPLALVGTGNQLNADVLVAERIKHQTVASIRAVRQHGRHQAPTMATDMNSDTLRRLVEDGPTLREKLLSKLNDVVAQSNGTKMSSSGLNRQVRWYGTVPGHATTVQQQNKATVQNAAASEFIRLRDASFSLFRGMHENFHLGNITPYNPLTLGRFIVAVSPVAGRQRIVLGEVVAMYSKSAGKGAKHEWREELTSLGAASYVSARVYSPMAGHSVFTSLDCAELSAPTLLHIPRTHILFSLASFSSSVKKQTVPLPGSVAGHSFDIVTLCATSSILFSSLCSRQREISLALVDLKNRLGRKASDTVAGGALDDDLEEGDDE